MLALLLGHYSIAEKFEARLKHAKAQAMEGLDCQQIHSPRQNSRGEFVVLMPMPSMPTRLFGEAQQRPYASQNRPLETEYYDRVYNVAKEVLQSEPHVVIGSQMQAVRPLLKYLAKANLAKVEQSTAKELKKLSCTTNNAGLHSQSVD